MRYRTLIVEDEGLARDELRYLLEGYPEFEIIGEGRNGDEAMELADRLRPDLIFLDIQMPGLNGLEVASALDRSEINSQIIFVTAYDEFAIKAFEVNATDYILKPYSPERIEKAVKKIKGRERTTELDEKLEKLLMRFAHEEKKGPDKLAVEENEKIILLNPAEILYAESEGKKVFIQTTDKRYKVNYTLQELEQKLGRYGFFRSHRGYLVNTEKVIEIHPWFNGAYQMLISTNPPTKIPVSRLLVKDMKNILGLD